MAINYFQQLGLNSFNPGEALAQGQAYKMNQFNLDTAKAQEAERIAMNQQKQQAAQLKFANEQQKARAAQGAGAFYNALNSGNKQAALTIASQFQDDINSLGDPSFTVDSVNELLQTPEGTEQLKQMSLGMVQMAGGPEQFAKFTQERQVKPMTAYEQAQSQAKQQDLALKSQEVDISKQRLDLDRESKKLEAMQKSAAATSNDLKREELNLKIEEQKQKIADASRQRETAANEKIASLESARSNLDNMLNTLARVEKTDLDVIENATGPVDQMLPTVRQSTADFQELVGTLGSQAFLSQIPLIKGMGQLSNAEGEKLQSALQNFSLRQSPERLKENLAEARRLLNKARANIAKQYGAQETKPDTPAKDSGSVIDWGSL